MESYFDEPRLRMNAFSRSIVRLINSLTYAFLTVLAPALLITDIPTLRWLGSLIALFLLDAFFHLGKSSQSLPRALQEGRVNIASFLSPKSLSALERALERSALDGTPLELNGLKILLSDPVIKESLSRLDADITDFEKQIDKFLTEKNTPVAEDKKKIVESLAQKAFTLARELGETSIEPRNLFAAIAADAAPPANRVFEFFDIRPDDLRNALLLARLHTERPSFAVKLFSPPRAAHHRVMNRAWTSRPTPLLDQWSEDFTDIARLEGSGPRFEHESEYRDLIRILAKPTRPNALLIGDPGSGKETIVRRLATEIVADTVPQELFDKRLVALRLGNLAGGATAEEIGNRINKIADEIIHAGNIILYIPDTHNLLKTSSEALSAGDLLLPIIRNDAFPVIGATFPREFKEFIEPNTDFSATFEAIRVSEMSEKDAIRTLTYQSILYETRYKTLISFGAIKSAVTIAHKYFRNKLLPASADDLLKEALAEATQRREKVLRSNDIISIAERKTNIPIHRPGRAETEQLLRLEETIHRRLVDQEDAVHAVANALREYRSGLARKGGPIASFLFVGPTGVGKTELAKTLAEIQFGSETLMARFDMSEYQDKQSFFRFIGSPDGKIAGMLTESIIQKPYSLVLLDEFEKSHPDILNLFLQVLDDGRLTDNLGRTVDFTNTIVIATSNAHSDFIKTHIDAHTPIQTIAEELKKKLADSFRPELLNRFSSIIVFKTLSPDDLKTIARFQLNDLVRSLKEAQGVELIYDDAVLEHVAELGFDPSFGARPLRQVLSDRLRAPLAERLLKGDIVHGDAVSIVVFNNDFQFQIKNRF